MQDGPTTCLVGLGGNVGPVQDTFAAALQMLNNEGCRVMSRSECHRSAPMGCDAGGTFTNAAACVITELGPFDVLDLLQDVERRNGRVRTVHWGPRRLDLDLLFYGQMVIRSERLTVPHPDLWYRRFVLEPLAEIAPEWKHPESAYTIGQLRERLDQRPLIIELDGFDVLPPIPDRFADGAVHIQSSTDSLWDQSSVQKPFCFLRRQTGDQQSQVADESETFRIDVREEDMARLLDVILSAALGK